MQQSLMRKRLQGTLRKKLEMQDGDDEARMGLGHFWGSVTVGFGKLWGLGFTWRAGGSPCVALTGGREGAGAQRRHAS